MSKLGLVFFTQDQDCFVVPMKPDRPRLRRVLGVDSREPDDLFLAQATIDVPAESISEVEHGALPIRREYSGDLLACTVSEHHGHGFAKLL
jgi:hypothetical protein